MTTLAASIATALHEAYRALVQWLRSLLQDTPRRRRPIPPPGGPPAASARDGMVITDRQFSGVGNGIINAGRPVAKITMTRLRVSGGYRVFENTAADGAPSASIDGVHIEDVIAVGLSRGFARIRYDSAHGEILRVTATGTGDAPALPCGIAFNDTAHDFTIADCIMRNFQMRKSDDQYWNGDGYSSERGNYGLRFLRCQAFDCTDAGFDLKSTGTFLDGCIASGNKRNFRFWGQIDAHVITSISPVLRGGTGAAAHVHVIAKETQPVVKIAKLIVRSDNPAPILAIDGVGATIVIDSHDISVPRGTPLIKGRDNAQVIWKSGAPRL